MKKQNFTEKEGKDIITTETFRNENLAKGTKGLYEPERQTKKRRKNIWSHDACGS